LTHYQYDWIMGNQQQSEEITMSDNTVWNGRNVRNVVFQCVPEYKTLVGRVKVSTSILGNTRTCTIALQTGLLTDDAEAVFDKVGTLQENRAKIFKAINKHFDINARDRKQPLGWDRAFRGQELYLNYTDVKQSIDAMKAAQE
jgi:hypothetical protein